MKPISHDACPACGSRFRFIVWRPVVECQSCGKRYVARLARAKGGGQ